jgi:CRISPR-associated protein Csd1
VITELLQLGDRLGLTGHEPFGVRPIHWFIDLDRNGDLVGISPTVAKGKRGKKGEWTEDLGKEYSCPVFFFMSLNKQDEITATAGGGRAVAELATGNIAEIWGKEIKLGEGGPPTIRDLPDKQAYKRNNFLALHESLARAHADSTAAVAINIYLQSRPAFPKHYFDDSRLKRVASQQFSFRVAGRLIVTDPCIRQWWQAEFENKRKAVVEKLPKGKDAFPLGDHDDCQGALTSVFPHVSGVPNSGPWCPLASFDKAPSQSYGLGAMTASVRLNVAEKATAALNWLLGDEASHVRMRDAVFIFWAVNETSPDSPPQPLDFGDLMSEADPLQVREFLNNAWGGYAQFPDTSRFYAAVLSSPKSRVTVRSWHTEALPQAVGHLRWWLKSSMLPNQWGEESPTSIMQLADCTIRKGKNSKPLPRTYSELFEAALFSRPLPPRLFSAALERQALELAKGCDKKAKNEFEERLRARTALVKLFFELNKKGEQVTMENHTCQEDAAYLCGRLLALLDKVHVEAHRESGGTSSSPANRAYSAASTTPALIFPQLCKLARYHLNKIGGGWASCLEHGYQAETGEFVEGLKQVVDGLRKSRMKESASCDFPRTLSLEQQGRFVIGFYYERCRKWPKSKKKTDAVGGTSQNGE